MNRQIQGAGQSLVRSGAFASPSSRQDDSIMVQGECSSVCGRPPTQLWLAPTWLVRQVSAWAVNEMRGTMIKRAAIAAVLGLVLFAQVAAAHSTVRCDGPNTPTGPAPSLQTILDGLVVSGPGIDANAPLNIELWQNSAGPMTVQVAVDYSPKSNPVFAGMYDPDSMSTAFFDLSKPSDVATVTFNDNGSITIRDGFKPDKASGFEGPFGFVVKASLRKCDSVLFYTQAALNEDGPRAKVFQGDGTTVLKLPGLAAGVFLPSQFLIAWETGLGDANDGQFNDFLMLVSNIVPVTAPEPSFALLLGISALAVVCGRRARST